MRFLHISDLHLGKLVLETSMLEDQANILKQAVTVCSDYRVDAVLIAGDIYDRSVPPAEAVSVLDEFLCELSGKGIKVIAASGNHDSPERLQFGSRLMSGQGVYIAGVYDGSLQSVTLYDDYGPVHVYTLPFLKPAMVRAVLNQEVSSTHEAVKAALEGYPLPEHQNDRNILVAHQFVCCGDQSPETCDSETLSVGGSDNVDFSCFDGFDYVALGHLHRAQRIGRETVRYAGSPLKYSLSEATHNKSFTLVTLNEKGNIEIELIPVKAPHDLRRIRGRLNDLIAAGMENPEGRHDYIHAVLTDREVLDPAAQLRMVYPNLLHVEIEQPDREFDEDTEFDPMVQKSEAQLFEDFYRHVHGKGLDEEQRRIIDEVLSSLKEDVSE